MEDPYLAVSTDSFNNPCSGPVPLVGTTPPAPPDPPSWRDDVRRICEHHHVSVAAMESDHRVRRLVFCRFEVFARLRDRGWSQPKIGLHVGGRDHTTVLHGLRRFDALVKEGKIKPLIF